MNLGEMKAVSCEVQLNDDDLSEHSPEEMAPKDGGIVSFHTDLPISLQASMTRFIELHPNWDQYRLIKAALAGFLVQNGVDSRPITRLYLGNMFRSASFLDDA